MGGGTGAPRSRANARSRRACLAALREASSCPGARRACLASFGTGAFEPVAEAKRSVTSFGATVQPLVRAATRTEAVHEPHSRSGLHVDAGIGQCTTLR